MRQEKKEEREKRCRGQINMREIQNGYIGRERGQRREILDIDRGERMKRDPRDIQSRDRVERAESKRDRGRELEEEGERY